MTGPRTSRLAKNKQIHKPGERVVPFRGTLPSKAESQLKKKRVGIEIDFRYTDQLPEKDRKRKVVTKGGESLPGNETRLFWKKGRPLERGGRGGSYWGRTVPESTK